MVMGDVECCVHVSVVQSEVVLNMWNSGVVQNGSGGSVSGNKCEALDKFEMHEECCRISSPQLQSIHVFPLYT